MRQSDLKHSADDPAKGQAPVIVWAVISVLVVKVVFLFVMAYDTQFVMDEFWQFGQSKYLGNGFFDTVWPAKAVGYAVFYKPAHWLGWDAVSAIRIGRFQTAILALGTLALLYGTARVIWNNRVHALLVILLTLSFSTFLERIFRTRSETLALFFAMAALYWIVSRNPARNRTILIAGCLCGLAFLATQKAVYFNGSLGLGLTFAILWHSGLRQAILAGVLLIAGWFVPIAIYSVAFGGWSADAIFISLFKGPVEVATNGHAYYGSLKGYFLQTWVRNILPYLLGAIGVVATLWRWKALSLEQLIALVFSVSMGVLIARHNQPWPYVFIMVIPFVALWAPGTLHDDHRATAWGKYIGYFWVFAVVLSFPRNITYLENNNQAATDVMRRAEALLQPGETYFDGIGMLSNLPESQRRWLDVRQITIAKRDGASSDVMRLMVQNPPNLFIESYRLRNLNDVLEPFLDGSYIRVSPNILLPGTRLPPDEAVSFTVPVADEYAIFDGAGAPVSASLLIDGTPADSVFYLDPGTVQLSLQDGPRVPIFVLPAHKTYSMLDPEPESVAIFDGIYTR